MIQRVSKIVFLGAAVMLANSTPVYSQATPRRIEASSFFLQEPTDTFAIKLSVDYGGERKIEAQLEFSVFGLRVVVQDPTVGDETIPTGTPDPNAPPPPGNGANPDETAVAGIMTCLGYENVINQPFGNPPTAPTVLPTDTNYLPGPPPGKYHRPNLPRPDLRIQGDLFDVYSPQSATPIKNVVSNIQEKTEEQCDRIIIKLPTPPTGQTVDQYVGEIVTEVNIKRNTPGSGIRDDLQELIVVKPDGTIKRLFPGGGVN